MKHRRSNIEIIADILRLGQAGKTKIMYSANMSYCQLQKYIDMLMERGFIDRVNAGSSAATYRTTEKGHALLELIESVLAMLSQETLPDSPSSTGASLV
jgi:predicted transcriptional regulator